MFEKSRRIDWERIEDIMEDTGASLDEIMNEEDPRMAEWIDGYGED